MKKITKKKERYERPKAKKEFFEPEMKKGEKFNETIGTCYIVYGACSSCFSCAA